MFLSEGVGRRAESGAGVLWELYTVCTDITGLMLRALEIVLAWWEMYVLALFSGREIAPLAYVAKSGLVMNGTWNKRSHCVADACLQAGSLRRCWVATQYGQAWYACLDCKDIDGCVCTRLCLILSSKVVEYLMISVDRAKFKCIVQERDTQEEENEEFTSFQPHQAN